jgi:UDP:flavonoid glycosyltransferase YjiC (YdhE family)
MARFLFLTWDGSGNQVPQLAAAQALVARGHRVEFAGYAGQEPRFRAAGVPFRVLPGADRTLRGAAAERPVIAMRRGIWCCPEHLEDVPRAVAAAEPDVLVVDCMMYGALAAAERLERPTAVLVHSAPGALAPPGGRSDAQFLPLVDGIRAAAGLGPVTRLWDTWAPFPTLCATLRELDPLGADAPASFAYVGPLLERPAGAWRSPWPPDDRRPLVVASFSTSVVWDQASRLRRTIDALGGEPCRLLVATGDAPLERSALPPNVAAAAFVPHAAVLPVAASLVTHAGHGSIAAALACGVPTVCLPNAKSDQPPLARRVQQLGAGIALDGDAAAPGEIRAAVRAVLADPAYAATARRLAARIAASRAPEVVCERLEALVPGVARPDARR